MASLVETPVWVDGIYQLEESDPVKGGPGGIDNRQAEELAKRTSWLRQLGTKRLLKSVAGGATVALSAAECAYAVLEFTGALTANIAVTVPSEGLWVVRNSTTGAFTLTVKTAAGAGVPIAQGRAWLVYSDGTNVMDAIADLRGIAALTAAGLVARTATGAAAARTLTAGTGVTVTNGDGVAGNPTVALTASGVVAGTYPKVTVDAYGRITAGAGLLAADIPALDWSKISTGKPTTRAGYGITDAQPLDAELTALAAVAANGLLVRTAAGAAAARTITAGTGVTVTNGDGVAGNPTLTLDAELTALAGIAVNGLLARTAAGVAAARTLTAGTGLTVTNGDGVAGNPTVALTASGVVAGTYPKVTVDAYGRITAGAGLLAADIPALDWSKISTGKPTTRAGYGITDAQPLDAELTALAGIAVNGLLARTAAGVAAARTLTAGTGLTVTNGDGVAGNPVIGLAAGVATPAGAVMAFARSTAPTGWLKANGAAISRTSYADLYAAIGITFGAGDGSTTFNLPDLRGEFLRGLDDGRGIDAGRTLGSTQSQQLQAHKHAAPFGVSTPGAPYGQSAGRTFFGSSDGSDSDNYLAYTNDGTNAEAGVALNAAGVIGTETRPRNVALLYCIKY